MTVNSDDRVVGPLVCDGSSSVYSYDFKIQKESDIVVEHFSNATGVVTVLSNPTEYTVLSRTASGGQIQTVSTYPNGDKISIYGQAPVSQPTIFNVGERFYTPDTQEAFDQLTRLVQELKSQVDAKLGFSSSFASSPLSRHVELSTPATGDVGKALAWKSASPPEIEYKTFDEVVAREEVYSVVDAGAPNLDTRAFLVPFAHKFSRTFIMSHNTVGGASSVNMSTVHKGTSDSLGTLIVSGQSPASGDVYSEPVAAGFASKVYPANSVYLVSVNSSSGWDDVSYGIGIKPEI